jgi:ribonuclease HI
MKPGPWAIICGLVYIKTLPAKHKSFFMDNKYVRKCANYITLEFLIASDHRTCNVGIKINTIHYYL